MTTPSPDSSSTPTTDHPSPSPFLQSQTDLPPISGHPPTNQSSVHDAANIAEATPTEPQSTETDERPPKYTRKLIRKIYIPIDEMHEGFDVKAWHKKVYGPDINILCVSGNYIPEGWILVDGKYLVYLFNTNFRSSSSAKENQKTLGSLRDGL